ncbi:MAG: glycosyltransferase family 9 protein, partial [Nitrospirales bacterium]
MQRILVIKLRYIGDVLLATPVLRVLREHFPETRTVMLVNEGTEEVLRGNPDADEVWTVAREGLWAQAALLRRVRAARFDCVIDLTDGDRSAFLTWISRAPVRIG